MDKFFLLILVLMVLGGGVAYDRFVTAREGVSPVARLLDSAGLSAWMEGPAQRESSRQRAYRVREQVQELNILYQQMEETRARLSRERADVLRQISSLSDQVADQARVYQEALQKERRTFAEENSEFKALLQELSAALLSSETATRQEQYAAVKEKVEAYLNRVSASSNNYPPVFQDFFAQAERHLAGELVGPADCGDPAGCLEKWTADFEVQAQDFLEQRFQQTEADIREVLTAARSLKREEEIYDTNLSASSTQILENNQALGKTLGSLSRDLTERSEAAQEALRGLYADLKAHQDVVVLNWDLNWQRLKAQQDILSRTLEKMPASLRSQMDPLAAQYQEKLEALSRNQQKDRAVLMACWEKAVEIVSPGRGGTHVRSGTKTAKVSQGQKPLSWKDRITGTVRPVESSGARVTAAPPLLQTEAPVRQAADRMTIKPRETLTPNRPAIEANSQVSEQMQRLRDKARDQGF